MERIVPANLEGDELWRRNGEYVDAESYYTAISRIAELEAALREAVEELEACARTMSGETYNNPKFNVLLGR